MLGLDYIIFSSTTERKRDYFIKLANHVTRLKCFYKMLDTQMLLTPPVQEVFMEERTNAWMIWEGAEHHWKRVNEKIMVYLWETKYGTKSRQEVGFVQNLIVTELKRDSSKHEYTIKNLNELTNMSYSLINCSCYKSIFWHTTLATWWYITCWTIFDFLKLLSKNLLLLVVIHV